MTRISGLTGATIETAPTVCHECIWWQTRDGRSADKRKWIRDAEDEWGAWGTVYHDDDGRLLGSMQYGPAELFPRARELPVEAIRPGVVGAHHVTAYLTLGIADQARAPVPADVQERVRATVGAAHDDDAVGADLSHHIAAGLGQP